MSKSATEKLTIQPGQSLQGTTRVPGDKSLSHRAILMGMLANGTTHVRGWLAAGDTEATLGTARTLGVQIERHDKHTMTIHGGTLHVPSEPLDFVNAGTGIRLAAGIMAGQPFASVLDGSEQLRRRPMRRILTPLQQMGANITAANERCPLNIYRAQLHGITYNMPEASAQVKSAILLAGLFAEGVTTVIQPGPTRDHTERVLQAMGANIVTDGNMIALTPGATLRPLDMTVPGDFSSAAFLIVAGLVVPGSDITLEGVNLNITRTGLIDALLPMGANITVTETGLEGGEPVGTIRIQHSVLRGTEIGGDLVVRMIDEFPVFMIAAICAEGETIVRDAQEMRVKETDRIAVMVTELSNLGIQIEERPDGFRLVGPQKITGGVVEGHDDHRIAMSLTVAGLLAEGVTTVNDSTCAGDSFPGFVETLQALGAQLDESPLLV